MKVCQKKNCSNNALVEKLLSMSEKLKLLNKFYSEINTNDSSPDDDILKYYKTAQSLAVEQKFSLRQLHTMGTEAIPNKKIFKDWCLPYKS